MYTPRHFKVQELVPPAVYKQRGAAAIELLDDRILRSADQLRDDLGAIVINDWLWGGSFTGRGLRIPGMGDYRHTSQHAGGRGLDLAPKDVSAGFMRKHILANPDRYPFITFVEGGTPTWVHIDCRNLRKGSKRIVVWTPPQYRETKA